MVEPVLSADGVGYRYPRSARPALAAVDLEIRPGEMVVLAGRSGSGKSTLLRAACGLVPHFHGGEFGGDLEIAGRSTREAGPAELAESVGFVAQEPETQVVSATVAAELSLPLELRGRDPDERARAVEEVALALAIEQLLDRPADSLSGGELQRVAIAAALVTRPRLLLLDEPTSQLDPVGGEELLGLLRRLNEEWGVTIVLGEHRLERCLAGADRVLALEGGRLIYDGPPGDLGGFASERAPWLLTPAARLFELAGLEARPQTVKQARALIPEPLPEAEPPPRPPATAGSEIGVLEARGLRVEFEAGIGPREALRGLDLDVAGGERIALLGPNGAGKSTLLRAIAGVLEPAAGSVDTPGGCALLTQRPDDYFVRERVGDELPGPEGARAMRAAGLDVGPERDPRDLSGGERQRLALAIAFAGRGAGGEPPAVVCLDEPTRGLDCDRKRDLTEWLESLAGAGSAVIVATHDVELAAAFADRVLLLARGELIADGPAPRMLAGGWYFATDVARITGGAAVTPEAGAALLGRRPSELGGGRR